MGLRELQIKKFYRSCEYPDLGKSFISKMLEKSVVYKRAVGFFSSSALVKVSKGLQSFFHKNGAKIQLIVSPYLSKEDVEAIRKGLKSRDAIVEESLIRKLDEQISELDCERLNILCHLIEKGILNIKIADKLEGMYHEKIGLFYDDNNEKIAFIGSLNESDNSFSKNFESIAVFTSWDDGSRVVAIDDYFDNLRENNTRGLNVYDFPEAVKIQLFKKFKNSTYKEDIDDYDVSEGQKNILDESFNKKKIKLYDYQEQAVRDWFKHNCKGLFDMATGTGKTITALTASETLLKMLRKKNSGLAVVIVCPYVHLVEQRAEEKENFGINFIKGYSKYNYLSELKLKISNFNSKVIDNFYFVTTNSSFKTEKIQNELKKIKRPILLIADEVHNFGSLNLRKTLDQKYTYRIGLSATIERHHDEEGTQYIKDYFGPTVIEYTLDEAIKNNVLTRYFYYPILTTLTEDEIDKYITLTKELKKYMYTDKEGNRTLKKEGKKIAIQRARIVGLAKNKKSKLKEIISKYRNDSNLLIYCGAGQIPDEDYRESSKTDGDEDRYIDEICRILGNDLNMKVHTYTSRENIDERKKIISRYKEKDLQAVVAIKCLDEGVNIPSIEKAFILASSTNPKEYIQRRGRVLRKYEGKKYSYIFDFITMPFDIDKIKFYSEEYLANFKTLAYNEVQRIREFSSIAENNYESDKIIDKINKTFNLNEFKRSDIEFEYIYWEAENKNNGK